ncbi:hypothetical protein M9H77_21272 [Catharanthus roseus]|uniref:Myricetin O-methyltransferase n=2 Tax=Catharanthus roseus TaxID=4058 RepID=MOMT_CATRO|nr:RecName: Full=Myricetin O-methyltransferase; AltName: Full=CrOMT2; AltName: Full=Flavonoid O-methyltransferase [Catharanthus roseus]AAM97497.1 flavonoid O-methyltransferase [Catharanthus roseus]KAI5661949.1 hypothetical protein M9H77_21272 [Catharanthus roseus]
MELQSSEIRNAQAHFFTQVFSFTSMSSLKCAVQLGIPDAIHSHGKPMALSDLTNSLPINPSKAPYIYRLMRILVAAGYFSEEEKNVYSLTPFTRLLLKNDPLNSISMVLGVNQIAELKAWNAMSEWFQNEDLTAFETAHGKNFWDFGAEDKYGKNFDGVMAADSILVSKMLIPEFNYLFEGLDSLVDVGGGTGTIAKAIAKSFPDLKCTVFDLPHVVANLESTENLEFVGGDMFEKIPSANAILLKWILHDWKDEECVKVLKMCRKAIPEKEKGGKVILIETVLMDSKKHENEEAVKAQISSDIDMMVFFTAKERTEEEWATLFREAGFSGYKIFPMIDFRSPIEVYP